MSPALAGGFLSTGPPGKSFRDFSYSGLLLTQQRMVGNAKLQVAPALESRANEDGTPHT